MLTAEQRHDFDEKLEEACELWISLAASHKLQVLAFEGLPPLR